MKVRPYHLDDMERLWILALIDTEQARLAKLATEYIKDKVIDDLDTFSAVTQDHRVEEERLQRLFEYLKSDGGERNDQSSTSNVRPLRNDLRRDGGGEHDRDAPRPGAS